MHGNNGQIVLRDDLFNEKWHLFDERKNLEKRLAEVEARRNEIREIAAAELKKYQCGYYDDWTVVCGVKENRESCCVYGRSMVKGAHFFEKYRFENPHHPENTLTGYTNMHEFFIFKNPVFFRDLEIQDLLQSHPRYWSDPNTKYNFWYSLTVNNSEMLSK